MSATQHLTRLQQHIDLISVPVFVVDECEDDLFRVAAINEAHSRLTGLEKEKVQGSTPFELVHDRETALAIVGHYRDCVETPEPISYREVIEFEGQNMVFDTTLQKFARRGTSLFRIVGTSQKVDVTNEMLSDIDFYISLARNTLTTMEMLMSTVATGKSLTISEREASLILARKALLSLDDIERAASGIRTKSSGQDVQISSAVRNLFLH